MASSSGGAPPSWVRQSDYQIRFEWGLRGVEALSSSDVTIIVDVLRFTTDVDAALSHSLVVYPYRWKDQSAAAFAASHGAVLADGAEGRPSLSPMSLLSLEPGTPVVLPSPNGATCAVAAVEAGSLVAAGCLRDASSVAGWAASQRGSIAVIAAGEQWEDGSLRPAAEDLIGAGSIISGLPGTRSPEAEVALAAFQADQGHLRTALVQSISGQELVAKGFAEDVDYAAHLNVSSVVPRLKNGAFV